MWCGPAWARGSFGALDGRSNNMLYLWSDAWLLQAIILATRSGPATLSQVIASADAVNHALPTNDELHGGFSRLTTGGLIEEIDGCFRFTHLVPPDTVSRVVSSGWKEGRQAAEELLGAESWRPETNVADPHNRGIYQGLTLDRIRQAETEYRRKVRMEP
jgi:hypothetical protein